MDLLGLGQPVDTADASANNVAGSGAANIKEGGMLPQLQGLHGAAPASSPTSASTPPGGDWTEPASSRGEGQEAGSLPWSVSQGEKAVCTVRQTCRSSLAARATALRVHVFHGLYH